MSFKYVCGVISLTSFFGLLSRGGGSSCTTECVISGSVIQKFSGASFVVMSVIEMAFPICRGGLHGPLVDHVGCTRFRRGN